MVHAPFVSRLHFAFCSGSIVYSFWRELLIRFSKFDFAPIHMRNPKYGTSSFNYIHSSASVMLSLFNGIFVKIDTTCSGTETLAGLVRIQIFLFVFACGGNTHKLESNCFHLPDLSKFCINRCKTVNDRLLLQL